MVVDSCLSWKPHINKFLSKSVPAIQTLSYVVGLQTLKQVRTCLTFSAIYITGTMVLFCRETCLVDNKGVPNAEESNQMITKTFVNTSYLAWSLGPSS